ncbi:MAG: Gfo/Idh/MocA family oxidoreductase [Chloroflexia bacterium]|nr:Gfo/Idh/MocA family oxidoreductase [Chloroflexia bacterium]
MTQEQLRVGILGAGNITRVHAAGWQTYPERAQITAVADVARDRAQAFSDLYTSGAASVYDAVEALVADPAVDVVDICLPHHLHTDAIIAAARAGKAILCEKPLCTNLDDATRIRVVIDETGVTFMSAHNQLFQPSLLEARRLMAGGFLGQPYFFRSIETFQSRAFDPWAGADEQTAGPRAWGWRGDVKQAGGGELLDTGYHATYRLLSLANDRPVEVTAVLSRFFQRQLTVEDTALVIVRFASGTVGEIITSWALDVVGGRHFEVSGELGTMAGGATYLTHQLYGWPEASQREFQPASTFTAEIGHFLNVVQLGASNPATLDHAARALQLIKAAYRSAEEGRTVTLPDDPTQPATPRDAATETTYSAHVPTEAMA